MQTAPYYKFYIGDKWEFHFGVVELPSNWESLVFRLDVGLRENLGASSSVTIALSKETVPVEETDNYAGWLYGAVERAETEVLKPGKYYAQVSLWDNGETQSQLMEIDVLAGFDREVPV